MTMERQMRQRREITSPIMVMRAMRVKRIPKPKPNQRPKLEITCIYIYIDVNVSKSLLLT